MRYKNITSLRDFTIWSVPFLWLLVWALPALAQNDGPAYRRRPGGREALRL